MGMLKSTIELEELHKRIQNNLAKSANKIQVKVHLGTCGISSGANQTLSAFEKEVSARNLSQVVISQGTCIGLCGQEPTVTIIHPQLGKTIYTSLTQDKVPAIIEEHLLGNKIVSQWTIEPQSPRLALQEIRILHNQDINPWSIEEYIARGGYLALAKVLTEIPPEQTLAEIKKSGLRGRGGAGFPTASKWGFVRNASGEEKYVVCNGDEGDPGAYMNRAVLEGNPHSIIEGMTIGAFCIGNVKQGYAYVRAEYPLAIKTLNYAINQAKEYGLLGNDILGTGFQFDLEIFPGAGAFVCGEETALLTSIEGNRGTPHQRPPFPANEGLFGKPTTVINVETWSNIPQIILNGADWFTGVGSKNSPGTKTLCLVGKVKDTGLVEVPLGTSLGKIIFDLGGGIQNDKKFKAAQMGGPSGGVIPSGCLNTPVDYDSIPPTGAIMGSGGVVVMDEDSCMVDVAKYFLEFTKDESCGKCISCRVGNPKMYDLLNKITSGQATMDDLKALEQLAELVRSASICGLGQTAPNPVLTTLRYFRDEYEAHILDKKCPAAVCQALFKAPCQHTCPVGLDIPGYVSLIKEGKHEHAYKLMMQHLPFPMSVGRVCPATCQSKCRRDQIDEAIAIRHLKRFAADYAFEHNFEYHPEIKNKKSERIAIIGSGPAGLSAAWDLAIEGYPVTIFESLPVAGGMMAVGIPEYRLPKKVLNREIENILKLGVEIKLNTRIDNIPLLLNSGFKAVLIAVGAHKGRKMGILGEDLGGVMDAIDFLRATNLNLDIVVKGRVAVIGGGNSAIDAARTALRKGASEVHILYRREQKDMPAEPEEIIAAEEEGIQIHTLTNPTKILGRDGKVVGIEIAHMRLKDFDQSGRRTSEMIGGSESRLEVEMVIEAVGQEPDTIKMCQNVVQMTKDGRIMADRRSLIASNQGVFASGDVVLGPSTVIEAIASGQRAAASIRAFLMGEKYSYPYSHNGHKPVEYSHNLPTEEEAVERPRVPIAELSLPDRERSFKETILSYGEDQAISEASRCLRCDLNTD